MKPGDLVLLLSFGWMGLPRRGSVGIIVSPDLESSMPEYPCWNVIFEDTIYSVGQEALEVLNETR